MLDKSGYKDFCVWLAFPLILLILIFKVERIGVSLKEYTVLEWVDVVRSDFLFGIGLIFIVLGFVTLTHYKKYQKAVLVLSLLVVLLVLFIEITSHWYFLYTFENTFDLGILIISFMNAHDTGKVVSGTISVSALSGYFMALSINVIFIILAVRSCSKISEHIKISRKKSLMALSSGIFFVAAAIYPSAVESDTRFARDAFLNFVVSSIFPLITSKVTEEKMLFNNKGALVSYDGRDKKNIVLIIMESTRSVSTTIEEPRLKTTPFLYELSKYSIYAENAYAVVPHTSKSLVSIICGIEPNLWPPITEAIPDNIPVSCLPALLKKHDYKSAFFQSATGGFENRYGLISNMGYDEFFPLEKMDLNDYEQVNYLGYDDRVMLGSSDKWLKDIGGINPFLATYLTVGSHHDYGTPSQHTRLNLSKDDTENRYLNALSYQDGFIKELIGQYKKLGVYENTIFIIMGDHGEGFGEHGRFVHNNTIYNEGLKVPYIVHYKGMKEQGVRLGKNISLLDTLHTAAELLGFQVRGGGYSGESIFFPSDFNSIKSSCWHYNSCLSIVKGDVKYIYHFDVRKDELFILSEDPGETNNLLLEKTEQAAALKREVVEWRQMVINTYEPVLNSSL